MNNNDESDETLDILGSSHLPSDLLTPSLGSSYLVGEDPTLEYGMGVLDGALNPEFEKAPALPTGLNYEASQRLALEEYLVTPEIINLEWLDPGQLQDPDRLPKDPHESLPELEELWGSTTNGQTIQANTVDLEKLRYEQQVNSREVPIKKFSERTFEKIVTAAMRRSAMGQDIDTVIAETLESVGESRETYFRAMRNIKAEHGLSGNVFIRKSAFPNFESGKWNDHIRKYHSSAKYIVVAKEDFEKTFIEDGRCSYSGKLAVLEVPWDSAFKHYAPRLLAAGYKVGSTNPSNALKVAFLRGPAEVKVETNFAIQKNPADAITIRKARQEFEAYSPERKVYDPKSAQEKKIMVAVERKLRLMVQDLGLSEKAATEILSSGAHPKDMLRSASLIVSRVASSNYTGENQYQDLNSERSLKSTKDLTLKASEIAKAKTIQRIATGISKVKVAIQKGLRGETLSDEIVRIFEPKDLTLAKKQLVPLLLKSGSLKKTAHVSSTYEGDNQYENSERALKTSKVVVLKAGMKVTSALSWVRRTMSEGFAGRDLDDLISSRFATDLLSQLGDSLSQTRTSHEGASGFLYVDAAAYASETGSKGCEKAALKHRTNGIPAVAAMDRCGSCVHHNVLEDGTPRCGVFNKTLLVDVETPDALKKRNIDSTNMTDAESTASYFSSMNADIFDPSEFGLKNSNLEDIGLDLPETEKISKILFGGWDI